jgi:membrane associated rhomboid family serine protease
MVIVPTEKRFDWKHAPVVLFLIVLLNVFIFVVYQTDDDTKYYEAVELYAEHNLLETEWPQFQIYLKDKPDQELLGYAQELYAEEDVMELGMLILSENDFYLYLMERPEGFLDYWAFEEWEAFRTQITEKLNSVSYYANGLVPTDISVWTLISHQFLHGGLMHLIGNMFFLIVCGFAVEAALGHGKFLLFYLLSGISGGLLYAVFNGSESIPLVGASGAISGVMAMYVAIFRLKKIEFFYWIFVFVGYFRAPALLILPFYIGKELVDYFSEPDAGIAFMAHVGGFVAGALLLMVTLLFKTESLNEEYIEEDQEIDPKRQRLVKVNQLIESYRFETAAKYIDEIINEYGSSFELEHMKFNLLKIEKSDDYFQSARNILAT